MEHWTGFKWKGWPRLAPNAFLSKVRVASIVDVFLIVWLHDLIDIQVHDMYLMLLLTFLFYLAHFLQMTCEAPTGGQVHSTAISTLTKPILSSSFTHMCSSIGNADYHVVTLTHLLIYCTFDSFLQIAVQSLHCTTITYNLLVPWAITMVLFSILYSSFGHAFLSYI